MSCTGETPGDGPGTDRVGDDFGEPQPNLKPHHDRTEFDLGDDKPSVCLGNATRNDGFDAPAPNRGWRVRQPEMDLRVHQIEPCVYLNNFGLS